MARGSYLIVSFYLRCISIMTVNSLEFVTQIGVQGLQRTLFKVHVVCLWIAIANAWVKC